MIRVLRMVGWSALAVCLTCWSTSDAQAGGRRYACHCQPMYTAAPANAVPAMAATTSDGRQRYQSAYQAPAQSNYYTAPSRPAYNNRPWDEKSFARHIKGQQ